MTARGGIAIDRSLLVGAWSRADLTGAIHDATIGSGYRPLSVALDRASFARSLRPRWATVTAIVTAPTVVGLLFLLVRSTESFTAIVREDHTGLSVRVHGRVDRALMEELTRLSSSGPARPVPAGAPAAGAAPPVPASMPPQPLVSPLAGVAPPPVPVMAANVSANPVFIGGNQPAAAVPPVPVGPPQYRAPSTPPRQVSTPPAVPWQPTPGLQQVTPGHLPPPFIPSGPVDLRDAVRTPATPSMAPTTAGPPAFGSAAVPSPWLLSPSNGAGDANGSTQVVARPLGTGTPVIAPGPSITLLLAGGNSVDVAGVALLGRNPSAGDHDGNARLVIVDDETVSKTHLAVGVTDGVAWVADRHSTNGSVLVDHHGQEMPLVPGQRVRVEAGFAVRLGAYWARIERIA